MEPITKVSHIPASRWALSCSLCREHTGTCIQVRQINTYTASAGPVCYDVTSLSQNKKILLQIKFLYSSFSFFNHAQKHLIEVKLCLFKNKCPHVTVVFCWEGMRWARFLFRCTVHVLPPLPPFCPFFLLTIPILAPSACIECIIWRRSRNANKLKKNF